MKKTVLFLVCSLFIILLSGCGSDKYIEATIISTTFKPGYTEKTRQDSYTIIERIYPDVYETKLMYDGNIYINKYKNVFMI